MNDWYGDGDNRSQMDTEVRLFQIRQNAARGNGVRFTFSRPLITMPGSLVGEIPGLRAFPGPFLYAITGSGSLMRDNGAR